MFKPIVTLAVAAAFLALPGAASASIVSIDSGVLSIVASPGEGNAIVVSASGGSITVTDGRLARAGAGCTASGSTVTCPAADVTGGVVALLGDRDDRFTGSGLDDVVYGGDGFDKAWGNGGSDSFHGDAGNDYFDGGSGPDTVDGGAGTDIAGYAPRSADLTLTIDGVANDGEALEGDNILASVETVFAGSGNDVLVGQDVDGQTLDGGAGDDAITGGNGRDQLAGNAGHDTIYGLDGDDSFDVRDMAFDTVYGGAGFDTARRDRGVDALFDIERATN